MKTLKKALAVIMCVVITLTAAPLGGFVGLDLPSLFDFKAEAESYSGTCGDNLTWTLDTETGELNITGTGAMTDWSSSSDVPWYSNRSSITSIVIGDGVTSVSEDTFYNYNTVTSVTIPDSVTTIGDSAFYGCTAIENVYYIGDVADWCAISFVNGTSNPMYYAENVRFNGSFYTELVIPDSVTDIGTYAFVNNTSITKVTIGNGVTSIGDYAFQGCDNLTEVIIGINVKTISKEAFLLCDGLSRYFVESSNAYYSSDEYGVLFNKDKTELVQYPVGNTRTSYTIPDGVTSIGDDAFDNCSSLTGVIIPDSVTSIGDGAFDNCSSLTSITIPGSVTSIGDLAFDGCASLEYIDVEEDNPLYSSDEYGVLFNKDKSTLIRYPVGNTRTNYTIPVSVIVVKNYAFANNKHLTEVYYAGTAEQWQSVNVGSNSLVSTNTDLLKILLLNTDTDRPFYAPRSCGNNLKWTLYLDGELVISGTGDMKFSALGSGSSATTLSVPWYSKRQMITKITIEDGVDSLANNAFNGCSNAKELTMPVSAAIYKATFSGCTGFEKITLTKGTGTMFNYGKKANGSIGSSNLFCEYSPWYISGCETVIIEDDVTSISDYAFYECDGLKYLTMPVTAKIYNSQYTFGGCTNIEKITLTGSGAMQYSMSTEYPEAPYYMYTPWYISGCETVVIGDGITGIGSYAFYNCSGIKDLTMPASAGIGDANAFAGCTGIEKVTLTKGTGIMPNYSSTTYTPWYISGCGTVIIEDGVTNISRNAFYNCKNLTSITIPESVTNVGDSAFYNCIGIKELSIPASATYSNYAFYGCTNIEKVTLTKGTGYMANYGNINGFINAPWNTVNCKTVIIEDGVKNIGGYAFYDCSNLVSVTVPDGIIEIGNCAFAGCTGLTSLTVPDSVTTIGEAAFSGCENLTSITIPDNVTKIEKNTFAGCDHLESITVPGSVTSIGEQAFSNCKGLETVTINNSVTHISDSAFMGCDNIAEAYYIGTVEQWKNVTVGANNENYVSKLIFGTDGDRPFYAPGTCGENLEWILYVDGELVISGTGAMTNWSDAESVPWYMHSSKITSVTIEDTVTSVGNHAFYNYSGIKELTMPASAKIYNSQYTFGGCTGIEKVTLTKGTGTMQSFENSTASSVNTYYKYTPWYISGCENIIIEDGVTNIGSYAFYNCDNLTSITIPDGITIIDIGAFNDCGGLTSITIPDSVKTIGISAFENCCGLTSITIPDSVTTIGKSAFRYCTALAIVIIGDGVTSIGESAFGDCINITESYFGGTVEQWKNVTVDPDNYYYTSRLVFGVDRPFYAPGTCGENLEWVLYLDGELVISGTGEMTNWSNKIFVPWDIYRSKITSVTIEDTVTSVGNYAFYNYSGIKELTMPASAKIYNSQYTFGGCTGIEKVTLTKGTGTMQSFENSTSSSINTYYQYTPWYISGCENIIIEDGVTNIGSYAFCDCDNLTSITIPDSVTTIGISAFENCGGLTSIAIPDSVTSIGGSAFKDCDSLKNITIPDGVTVIGFSAFEDCDGLTSIAIPDSVKTIGDSAFYNCKNLTSVTVGNGVTSIGNGVFGECNNITESYFGGTFEQWKTVTVGADNKCYTVHLVFGTDRPYYVPGTCGENLEWILYVDGELVISGTGEMTNWSNETYVPWYAYRSKITSVTIEDTVASVGNYAFYNYSGIKELTMPASAGIGGANAFAGCTGIEKVTLTKGTGTMQNYGKGSYLYTPWYISGCETVIIEDGVTNIGDSAFYNCTGIKSFIIPDSVTYIDQSAFSGCSGIKELTIPASAVNDQSAFYNCTGIEKITISKGSGIMPDYAILSSDGGPTASSTPWYISGCETVIIEDGVTNIGNYAFYHCGNITSITLPDSITSIGNNAFYDCSGITDLTLPDSLTSIGNYAFYLCTGITDLTFNDGLESIGTAAFSYCSGISTLIIPDSVTSVGTNVFADCTGLKNVTIGNGMGYIKGDTFSSCNNILQAVIPTGITKIEDSAFSNCSDDFRVLYTGTVEQWKNTVHKSTLDYKVIFDSDTDSPFYLPGTCGKNLEWVLYTDGHLIISGTGAMYDVSNSSSAPWSRFRSYIKKVTINNGVTSIGDHAFENAENLTEISIPDSVTSIGDRAFVNCTALNSISIPDSVSLIGLNAFENSGYYSDSDNWIDGSLYNGKHLIKVTEGATGTYQIKDGTITVAGGAFEELSEITEVVFPDGLQAIGECAFSSCTGLTEALLPDSIKIIDDNAFAYCSAIEKVELGNSIVSIGKYAFESCKNLKSIVFPETLTNLGKYAFLETGLVNIEVPGSIKDLAEGVFSNCVNLETVILNEGTESVNETFIMSVRLKHIAIPSTVKTITEGTFYDCVSLNLVIYPGTEEEWHEISVGTAGNEYFIVADTVYNHWHDETLQLQLKNYVLETCENPGYTGDLCCSLCSWVFEVGEHRDALGHNYSHTVIDATCVSNGFKYTVCLNCKQSTIDEMYAATGHSYKSKVTKPTCTDGGYTLNVCSKCGLSTITDETEALGHDYEETVIEATCTRDGYTVHRCSRCNASYIDGENPAFGHSYVDTEVKSTCTGVGYTSHKCSTCGDEYVSNEIAAKGHSYEPVVIAADCVTAGYTIFICADCGIAYRGDEIPAKGHSYKNTVIEPTCTEGGHTVHECAACGDTYIDSYTEKLGHNYAETVVAPTCENQGYTRHECSNCHDCYDTDVVPATGHDMKSAVVEATCTSDGFTVNSCTKCGYSSITNETKAYGHNYQKAIEIKHTCIQDGCTLNICANCNGVSKTEGTPATGHSFGEWGIVREAGENTEGLQTRACKNCGYTEEQIISMIQRTTFNITFKADGETVAVVEYLKGATEVEEPPVPHKARHIGRWSDYSLNDSDITVEAIYEVIDLDTLDGIDYGKSSVYDPNTGVATINVYAASSGKTVVSTTTVHTPLDIILVVDQSGSMDYKLGGSTTKKQALINAANNFVNAVYDDAAEHSVDHRIAVVGFGMGNKSSGAQYPAFLNTEILTTGGNPVQFNKASAEDYTNALMSVCVDGSLNKSITKAVNNIDANGATAADYGLSMANSIFANNSDASDRERIVVFMTDGAPTYASDFSVDVANSAILQANELKNTYGASVYSIGVMSNEDINQQNVGRFMEYVSSNYSNAQNVNKKYTAVSDKYYMYINNTNALNDIFTGIVTENITRTADFENITVIDTVSEYFTLTSQQEKALRINLIETFGIRNSDIVVDRKSDGTTEITVNGLSPVDDGEKFVIDFSFEVSANQRAASAGVYPTNTADSGILIDGAEIYECVFAVPNITVPADRKVAVFRINGEIYEISTCFSDKAAAPKTDFIGDYQFTGWDLKSDDLSDGYAEYDSTYVTQSYVVIWNIDGEKKTVEYVPGQVIDEPVVFPDAGGNAFRRWNGKVPLTMPASSIEFTAVYGDHEHNYVTETVAQVTCTMDGMIKHTCSTCGDSYSETVKCIGEHSWKAIAGSSADETSYETFECEYCGEHNGYSLEYTEKENNGNAYGHVNKKQKVNEFNYVDGDGNKSQPDGNINITSTVYDDFADAEDVLVYRVNENGENVLCDSEYENGVLSFETNHFSTYIFVPVYKCATTGNHTDSESDNYCDICGSQIEKEITVSWYVDGKTIKTDTYRKGDLINAPEDPTKDGADFAGWNPDVPTYAEDEDLNFVAKWNIAEHEHSSVTIGAYAPTYTKPGYTGDEYCSVCGELLKLGDAVSATVVYANGNTVIDSESNTIYGLSVGVNSIDEHLTVADDKYSISYQSLESGIGTGSKIFINSGDSVIAKYTVIIFGDVDGNGWYDANDAFLVNMIANGLITVDRLSAVQFKAADCNHDGVVDSADFYLLSQASIMLDDIDQFATRTELEENVFYIGYCSLIDQTAGEETDFVPLPAPDEKPSDTTADTELKEPEENKSADEINFEVIFTTIFDFIKKIFTLVLSFVVR